MDKDFLTYEQQLQLLRSKGLTIVDEEETNTALIRIGYFQLIGGYKTLFKNPTTRQYRDGVLFSDILALYRFDENLRHIFLRYLLNVEKALKTQIAHVFCESHGESQTQYLSAQNYNNTSVNSRGIAKMIGMLDKLANHSTDYPYINHHQLQHRNVPLWVLINATTFGTTSKMYFYLPQSLQSKICKRYPLNTRQMAQMLSVMTKFRNVCAHGERLYSFTTCDDIPDLPLHQKLDIQKKGQQYLYGKRDLFALMIALRYLLPSSEFGALKKAVSREIQTFSSRCQSLESDQLLQAMGFPKNWKHITRYRL